MKRDNNPPKLAQRALDFFLRKELVEEVMGDLDEKFASALRKRSLSRARINYWYQTLHYIRPFAIRKINSTKLNSTAMYRNYFTIGWRNLIRSKWHAAVNIGGLALGMTVAMLIGLWIFDEVAYNTYHANYDRIARVMRNGTLNGETFATPYQPVPLAEELQSKYGDNFKHVVKATRSDEFIISTVDNKVPSRGQFTDPALPAMLSLKMISGTLSALNDPHAIIVSESFAKALFGDDDPMEKQLLIDNKMEAKVTGVYQDLPHNSAFSEDAFLAPWSLFEMHNGWVKNQGFSNNFLDVFVELSPSAHMTSVTGTIKDAILKNISSNKEYVAANPQIFLHPMKDWHLYGEWKNGKPDGGLIQFVWLFGIIGAFVLLLACINFMNLTTARSERRAREVGIRKAMGSARMQLVQQFFVESFVVVICSFLFSLIIVVLSLNWFNQVSGKEMAMQWTNQYFWFFCLGFIFITGLLAGSYPALYLSSFHPVKVLKGIFRSGNMARLPRKVLVIVQFTVSVTLVIGTIVVYQQIQHAKNREVGYTRDGLLMIKITTGAFFEKFDVLKNELKKTGMVKEVSTSGGTVTQIWSSQGGFNWRNKPAEQQAEFATLSVHRDYGKTVGWELTAGRDFSTEMASDSAAFIVTESAAKMMNLENPVGEIIHWEPGWMKGSDFRIIGVIKDMVMNSPFESTMPTIFYPNQYGGWMNIRLTSTSSSQESIGAVEKVFSTVLPEVAFDYKFADQEYDAKFRAEERIGKLSTIFATLAIIISSLGMFGLASFIAEQRTKEIGIRKILGAPFFNLWRMLSKDFVILVMISTLIAIPLSIYLLDEWLGQYDYKVKPSVWIYIVTAFGAWAMTLLTVSFQTIKAVMTNPVETLKSE